MADMPESRPYSRYPDGPQTVTDSFIACTGVEVRSATIAVADGKLPALMLEFYTTEGRLPAPPILLVLDPQHMAALPATIAAAAADAIEHLA